MKEATHCIHGKKIIDACGPCRNEENKEVRYTKGEHLNTAEKFVKWTCTEKPYWYEELTTKGCGTSKTVAEDYYYFSPDLYDSFELIEVEEPKVKKLYALLCGNGKGVVFSKVEEGNDQKHLTRIPEYDIVYPPEIKE